MSWRRTTGSLRRIAIDGIMELVYDVPRGRPEWLTERRWISSGCAGRLGHSMRVLSKSDHGVGFATVREFTYNARGFCC